MALGTFDGVHRGHQALLGHAIARARERGGESCVLTFDPHPARVFAPQLAPPTILTLSRRLELFAAYGIDIAIVEPFNRALAAWEPEAFVDEFLARDCAVEHVVVGYDFTFGRNRRGTTTLLQERAGARGIGVDVVPPVRIDGLTCSSTKVREFMLEGRMEAARLLLGRLVEIEGPVVRGAARGRAIGYPTANIAAENELLPRPGIYAARARLLSRPDAPAYAAALSVGTNPTFVQGGPLMTEAYLLDFDGSLYDERVRLEVLTRLRDEQRYDSVESLVAQIARDVERTRAAVDQDALTSEREMVQSQGPEPAA